MALTQKNVLVSASTWVPHPTGPAEPRPPSEGTQILQDNLGIMSQFLSFNLVNRSGMLRTRRNNFVSTNQHQHDLWGCLQRCSCVQVCRVLQNQLCCTHQEWRRSWTCTVAGRGSRAIDCVIDSGASILRIITACHMHNSEKINIHLPVSTSLTLVG